MPGRRGEKKKLFCSYRKSKPDSPVVQPLPSHCTDGATSNLKVEGNCFSSNPCVPLKFSTHMLLTHFTRYIKKIASGEWSH
jgi:hypothetical protein